MEADAESAQSKGGDGMNTYPIALNARAWLKLQFQLRTWQAMAEYYRRHNAAASTPVAVRHEASQGIMDASQPGQVATVEDMVKLVKGVQS